MTKTEGKTNKWKWLMPQMSYRGRTLVLNNLVASMLWHRLACLDLPAGFLAQIQAKVVDFFLGFFALGATIGAVSAERGAGPHPPGQPDWHF